MKFMGIDVSTCTGVAVLDKAGKVVHAQDVSYPKLTGTERAYHIANALLELADAHKPEGILIEDYAVGKFAGSAIVSIEVGFLIRFLLWQEGYTVHVVSPSTLKKFVTGKGNAKKDQMTLEVFKRFKYSAASNDIADAVALAHLMRCSVLADSPAGKLSYTAAQRLLLKSVYALNAPPKKKRA